MYIYIYIYIYKYIYIYTYISPNNKLKEMVDLWNTQFDTFENKEDFAALIISKLILIEVNKNTLLEPMLKI